MPIRLYIIWKDDQKISISIDPTVQIISLKPLIEKQFYELHRVSLSISSLQDSHHFAISNHSTVGDHFAANDTVHLNAVLTPTIPLTHLLLAFRYSARDLLHRVSSADISLVQLLEETVSLGFWISHFEVVSLFVKCINDRSSQICQFVQENNHEIHILVVKFVEYWLCQVQYNTQRYQFYMQMLILLNKLTLYPTFIRLFSKINLKLYLQKKQYKFIAQQITNNLSSQKQQNRQMQHKYTIAIKLLRSSTQQNRFQGLKLLSEAPNNPLPKQLFSLMVRQPSHLRQLQQILTHSSPQLPPSTLPQLHKYILQCDASVQPWLQAYLRRVREVELEEACPLLVSPCGWVRECMAQHLARQSEHQPQLFIPHIKHIVKGCLTSDRTEPLLITLANLTLVQDCQEQILAFKGLEVLAHCLDKGTSQEKRAAAKALLNLSLQSKLHRGRVMDAIQNGLQSYYGGDMDAITKGYIQGIVGRK